MIQECLIRQKLRNFFSQKNCLIRREIAKKNRRQTAVFGGSGGSTAVSSVFRVGTFNYKNLQKIWIIIIKNAPSMA